MKKPSISIITPCYNSQNYLNEMICSVLSQTYTNWELIIVDDHSSDNSTKIIEKFIKEDSRIKLIKLNKNKGPAHARNKAISIAKKIGKMISTNYYTTEYSTDVKGVEFSSAIKNIYSMVIGSGEGNNTSSALFRKSFDEMEYLIHHFKGKKETVRGLAGLGDLYVSAVGGRNSKMGEYLGKGFSFKNAKNKFMKNDTVEGADLANEIAPYIRKKISKNKIPLMIALLDAITKNKKLKINY